MKSTTRMKLKAAHQEEQIQKWKEYFKNLHGNTSKVTDKSITKIIFSQLDIKRRKNLMKYKEKFQAENVPASMKYLWKYGIQGNLMTYFFDFAMPSINKTLSSTEA